MYSSKEKKHITNPDHYIVKPVLRGHFWAKKTWSYKTGDL